MAIERDEHRQQRITWGRGLFRFWVVLTAIWVAAVTALFWGDLSRPYIPDFVVSLENAHPSVFEHYSNAAWNLKKAREAGQLREIEVSEATNVAFFVQPQIPDDQIAQRLEAGLVALKARQSLARSEKRREIFPVYAAVSAAPPLVALILGSALLWALRGFRP